jgi:formyl-CoA transferase
MWRAFASAIGREDLLADPRYQDAKSRWLHRDELNTIFRAWTGARTKHEVLAVLGKAGVPCGAIQDTGEVLDDPHLNARGQIDTIDHPTRGRFRLPACPVRLSGAETPTTRPPLAGEHTVEILGEVLGLSKDDVEALHARGAI